MLHDDVAKDAGIVSVVCAAVLRLVVTGRTFRVDRALGARRQAETGLAASADVAALVADGEAVDDNTAPLLHVLGSDGAVDVGDRRQGNRRVGTTVCDNPRAAVDDHEVRVGLERKRRAGLDRQRRPVAALRDARSLEIGLSAERIADEQACGEDVRAAIRQRRDQQVFLQVVLRADKGVVVHAVAVAVGRSLHGSAVTDVGCAYVILGTTATTGGVIDTVVDRRGCDVYIATLAGGQQAAGNYDDEQFGAIHLILSKIGVLTPVTTV